MNESAKASALYAVLQEQRKIYPCSWHHNPKVTEFLKVSGRTQVTVYETQSYKRYQKNRPPHTPRSPCASGRCTKVRVLIRPVNSR